MQGKHLAAHVFLDRKRLKNAAPWKIRGHIFAPAGGVYVLGIPALVAFRTQWRPGDQFLMRHLDAGLMIVEKKAGLLTHSTPESRGDTLHELLQVFCERRRPREVLPVHRLDRVVSGLLVYARTRQVQEELIAQFTKHAVERRYVAAVKGLLPQDSGTFRSILFTESRSLRVYSVPKLQPGARHAVTHWKVLERMERSETTLVEVKLETGLRNQIRVHFAEGGFPVLGERKYAKESRLQGQHRIFLHAQTLGFWHPLAKEQVEWTSPLPADLSVWKEGLLRGKKNALRAPIANVRRGRR